jgi:hypothetical protein
MRHLFGGIVTASLLLLVACGGDGDEDSGDDGETTTTEDQAAAGDEYVDALAETMTEGQDEISLDDETAECVATATIDMVGADALEEAGISPEDLAEAESFADVDVELPADAVTQLGTAIGECEVAEPMRPILIEGFVSGSGADLPAEATTCLEENIDDEGVGNALATAFVEGSGEGFETALADAVAACPSVPTAILLAQEGFNDTPEAQACVEGFVQANPDLAKAAFVQNDSAAQEQMGAQIAGVCPQAFSG